MFCADELVLGECRRAKVGHFSIWISEEDNKIPKKSQAKEDLIVCHFLNVNSMDQCTSYYKCLLQYLIPYYVENNF